MVDRLTTLPCPLCAEDISVEWTGGAGAFACPLCGGEFQLEDPAETQSIISSGSSQPTDRGAAPRVPSHRTNKRLSGGAIALATILIVGIGIASFAILASRVPLEEIGAPPMQSAWPIANQSGHTIEGVTVRVQSVQIGPVRAKNSDGTPFTSDRQDYWTVKLRIRNGGEKPIEFRSWHATEFPGAQPAAATMTDQAGDQFVMQQFEDVALIQGQTLKKTLAPRESTLDVIVFEAPEDLDRAKLAELRLELPGAACQIEGAFRQIIPKSLIEE